MPLPFFARTLKFSQSHRLPRVSTQQSLDASAALPNSGIVSLENAQGASAAAAQLSRALNTGIDRLDSGLSDTLADAAAQYDNAHMDFIAGSSVEWSPSSEVVGLVSVACTCALAVYEPEKELVELSGIEIKLERYIAPTRSGTGKATSFFGVRQVEDGELDNSFLPAYVIAVRGTASGVDHMVNLNGEPRDATGFLKLNAASATSSPLVAHAGFLNAAETLVHSVIEQLDTMIATTPYSRNVIFTGHSAGGAVSSLLYAKFCLDCPERFSNLTFSLITFGAPPVTAPPVMPFLNPRKEIVSSPTGSIALAIVNAFDIVARADPTYIERIVELLNTVPPVLSTPLAHHKSSHSSAGFGTAERSISTSSTALTPSTFALPPQVYHPIGYVVTLWEDFLPSATMTEHFPDADGAQRIRMLAQRKRVLRSAVLKTGDLAQLLWCRIDVHRREAYKRRVGMVVDRVRGVEEKRG